MIQLAAQPMAEAAISRFWQSAPAESSCSHTGVFLGSSFGDEITITIRGARIGAPRASASSASPAPGFAILSALANVSPSFFRASPSTVKMRHGSSLR